jgi:hypothetical protein
MTTLEQAAPHLAGWYPDPDNPTAARRYWDGGRWTDSRAPIETQATGPRNGMAVTAFILGLVGATIGLVIAIFAFPLPLMLGIAAVPLGFLGYRRVKKDPSAGRKGLAIWGIALGCLSITWGIVGAVAFNNAVNDLDTAVNDLGKGTATGAPAPNAPADQPPSKPPPQAQGPETFQLGESAVITNGSGRTLGTYQVEAADVTTQVGHGYMAETPSHGYFVEVTLKAHASGHGFSVNPYDWVLIDPRTGHRYEPGDGNSLFGPSSFNAATLYPGETYSGKTTFDVPVQQGQLALLGGSWGDKVIGIWKFGDAASAPQTTQPTALAQEDISRTLVNHFRLIEQGQYSEAYADLTPSLGTSTGGESAWIQAQKQDLLYDSQLSVNVTDLTASSATANIVSFRTHSADNGCKSWSGYWTMEKSGETWLMDQAVITPGAC